MDEIELSDEQEAALEEAWERLDKEREAESQAAAPKGATESLREESSRLLNRAMDVVFGDEGLYP